MTNDLNSNNASKLESKVNKLKLEKFLNFKTLKIIIISAIFLISLVIVFNLFDNKKINNKKIENKDTYLSAVKYSDLVENKLENLLSKIDGAGNVCVMVSLDGSPELIYASDEDKKTTTNSNGSVTTSSSSPIIISGGGTSSALVLKENLPAVKGVIVVSSGANNISVKLDILNAISTLLDISTDKINVIKGI